MKSPAHLPNLYVGPMNDFSQWTHRIQFITLEGHTWNVTSVSFHSEGKWLVTGSEDGTIKIWDLRSVPGVL